MSFALSRDPMLSPTACRDHYHTRPAVVSVTLQTQFNDMKNFWPLILSATLITACSNEPATDTAPTTETTAPVTTAVHEHQKPTVTVKLVDGKRWEANPETTEGIAKMKSLVSEFKPGSGADDYHVLQSQLDAEFNGILQKCTMSGDAHDQLHNYLVPIKEMSAKLSDADPATREKAVKDLAAYLGEYGNYFQ
jgi:hypothetical protein